MVDKYYPLHVHTATGSVRDSVVRIDEYVERGVKFGLDALAITDHGSLSSIYTFADACKKKNIKPIIGMEAYICEDNSIKDDEHAEASHLVLLAATSEGLRNLLSIHNNAAVDGFYRKPRTDFKNIKEFGKGIIALSACVGGQIPKAILSGDKEKCLKLISLYKDSFDEFFLEIQPGSFPAQLTVNDELVRLSLETSTPIVVTNDIHYLDKEDYMVHDLHVKLGRKLKINPEGELCYPDTCYWFMNNKDIWNSVLRTELLTDEVLEAALENAKYIANKCSCSMHDGVYMPEYPTREDSSEEDLIYNKCYEELDRIKETLLKPQEYVDRLEYELKTIRDKGFYGYFLIVQDYVNYAREQGIPVGPARGSAAGSLVNYLLGISKVDPIRYGLMFERFMDPHREATPDIDVDFSELPGTSLNRDSMFDYAVKRYGHDHCARVSTFQVRKAKGAIRDCARVLGYEPSFGDEIAKLLPSVYYGDNEEKVTDMSIEEAIKCIPEVREKYEEYPQLFEMASKLEGLPSAVSIHAAGCIISPVPLQDKLPLRRSDDSSDSVLATSVDLDSAELNFVKFDYLGVVTLAVIKGTALDVGWDFDYTDESLYHDEEVWNIIGSNHTDGLFQIGSKTYKARMPRLKPRNLSELAACLALVRGPAISAKTDQIYMEILEGKREIEHIHPLYDQITANTNGILIYQEQIMQLAVAFGMDLTKGYRIVKLSAKKKMDKLQEYREEFVSNALQRNCDEETANRIFDMVVDSGKYSFNLSHAVSYAMLCYCSAYMKVHFPAYYMSNLLTDTYERGKKDIYQSLVDDCRRMGISFLPADINKSNWRFTVDGSKIRVGLCSVKGLGKNDFSFLQEHRPILSLEDLMERVACNKFNKKPQTLSIFAGLLDSLCPSKNRKELYEKRVELVQEKKTNKKDIVEENFKIGKDVSIPIDSPYDVFEREIFGVNFMYDAANDLKSFGWDSIKKNESFSTTGVVRGIRKIKTKKGEDMAFIDVSTGDGSLKGIIFPSLYKSIKKTLSKGTCNFVAKKDNEESCILSSIEKLTG